VHVLDGDLLLALAAVAVERFERHGECPGQLVRLAEVLPPLVAFAARFASAAATSLPSS
jgi:hypothetical protein